MDNRQEGRTFLACLLYWQEEGGCEGWKVGLGGDEGSGSAMGSMGWMWFGLLYIDIDIDR